MTSKILTISIMCLSCMTVMADETSQQNDSLLRQVAVSNQALDQNESFDILQPLAPTYHRNVSEAANWGRNWFIEIKGGASSFLGTPIGCGDVFDRLTPTLQVGLGKWFTPAIGGRVSFQGLTFKNAEFRKMKYQFVHADFLYNVTAFLGQNDLGISRWDVIPYVGIGMIRNADWSNVCACPDHGSERHPFAFSYGVEARYRLNNRMHLVAEISNMTTAKNFDCVGTSAHFGDHMLSVSAGLSLTIGKAGYRRVIDANPFIAQNEMLIGYAKDKDDLNRFLSHRMVQDERIIGEYQKILQIEGILDKYKDRLSEFDTEGTRHLYPKNDYSGLNSLRARISKRKGEELDGMSQHQDRELIKDSNADSHQSEPSPWSSALSEEYMQLISEGKSAIGAPIYFFFHISTATLTEENQVLNINEIAKIANEYSLKIRIAGAADSATGSESINRTLSCERAEYIKRLLLERGVTEDSIITVYEGGIDDYSPIEANRHTCVSLFMR